MPSSLRRLGQLLLSSNAAAAPTLSSAAPDAAPRSMRGPALGLASAAGIAILVGCAGLDVQQRKWIFQATAVQPDTSSSTDVSATSVPGMDDVWIEHVSAESGQRIRLHGLWHRSDDPKAPLLLYLHGARRNVEASAFRIRQMGTLGFSVLAVDYRGFGRSTDELPSEAAVYEDARAAWDWLGRQHPGHPRYVFGHSLGGAIAIQLASEQQDADGLIVEGTFTSIRDMFQSMRWGWLPITPLITQHFDSLAKIGRVKVPVLVVHGTGDSLVPPALARTLYEHASARKRLVLVEGGSHYSTNSLGASQYRLALHDLFGLGDTPGPVGSTD
ncbi:MAG: alpha/beta fold hydrolase [Caldimonas sp.]